MCLITFLKYIYYGNSVTKILWELVFRLKRSLFFSQTYHTSGLGGLSSECVCLPFHLFVLLSPLTVVHTPIVSPAIGTSEGKAIHQYPELRLVAPHT